TDGELRLSDGLSVLADRRVRGLKMNAVDENAAEPRDDAGRHDGLHAGHGGGGGASAARDYIGRNDRRDQALPDLKHGSSLLSYVSVCSESSPHLPACTVRICRAIRPPTPDVASWSRGTRECRFGLLV